MVQKTTVNKGNEMKQKTVTLVDKMRTLQKSMIELSEALKEDHPDKAAEIKCASQIMDSWITGIKNEK